MASVVVIVVAIVAVVCVYCVRCCWFAHFFLLCHRRCRRLAIGHQHQVHRANGTESCALRIGIVFFIIFFWSVPPSLVVIKRLFLRKRELMVM